MQSSIWKNRLYLQSSKKPAMRCNTTPGPRSPAEIAAIRRVRLCYLVLPLAFSILSTRSPAQQLPANLISAVELPDAPAPQLPAPPLPAQSSTPATLSSITGFVTDIDGASIVGARITLTPTTQQPAGTTRETISGDNGSFTFPNLAPGSFKLSVAASGFATQQTTADLHPGEDLELPYIALTPASSSNIQVTATQADIAEAQINQEEKQRVLGIIPNYYVSYIPNPVPLNPRQKFELAARTLIDPVSLILNGIDAGIQQAGHVYDWGEGAQGYAKRYAADYGTFLTGTLIGNAALPILFKQDPRYFYKGTGSIRFRVGYAIANAVICKGDNHRWQPSYSSILGGLAASGIANAYYPKPNRSGAELTFENAAIGTGITAISNLLQEFLIHKLTPHIPPRNPNTP
jgi:hypothetical protein